MLRLTKNKEFIGIIKSGLVGALAFTGIIFIWVIVSIFRGPRAPAIITTHFDSPKVDFAKEALTVIVCIGFMMGVLLRRHFPIMQRRFLLLVIPLFMVVVPLGFGICLLHEMAMGTELPPVNLKLADVTNSTTNIHLKVPKGHGYYLELAMPDMRREPNGDSVSSYKFLGRICISNETSLVADFPISSDKAFLDSSGFVLTGGGVANTNGPVLSKFLQTQKDYDIEIILNPPPPPLTSIQLRWWQAYRDR
jgi:hypothetical protein